MPTDFIFSTDDSCDLPAEYLREQDIPVVMLSFLIDGVQYKQSEMGPQEFYRNIRAGKMPITSQINVEEARSHFEPFLKQGKDVFHLAFSSGLSGSCASAQAAAKALADEYPERRIVVVDSLAASLGQGLIVYKLAEMRRAGATIDDMQKYVEDTRDHVAHIVAVEDLMHLHRGGRVSRTSAVAGSLLGIKPILQLNREGKLEPIGKIRGRKQALTHIVDTTVRLCQGTENDIFMVSHSDCAEDAQFVADMIQQRTGVKKYLINYIGPVIGSHTGVGTVAIFMVGNKI